MKEITLKDGRTLGWCEWGPDDGVPVIFCTGAGMSGSLGFGYDHLERLGIRLIAPHRPGSGSSSIHRDKTLTSWAGDVAELLAHERIQACHVVGFSMGTPFALALTGVCEVKSLALVAGQDQFSYPETYQLLSADVKCVLDKLHHDAAEFERMIAAQATADWLWGFIINTSSEQDASFYTEAVFSAAYRQCLQEGFMQGAESYARDLVNAWGEWPVRPEEVDCPVSLWYGAFDHSDVHSPDAGASLERRFPHATRNFLPYAGNSVLWIQAGDILAAL
ncbi:alpha/beta fold hydrolase (plasmid) [Klebsiella sp. WOUb02]|uniref:alpha/beta fold hydrolase n=1 Tax=Klebsiella sp. WOUb02 TaxID=3161071 RepID=UPI003CEEB56C